MNDTARKKPRQTHRASLLAVTTTAVLAFGCNKPALDTPSPELGLQLQPGVTRLVYDFVAPEQRSDRTLQSAEDLVIGERAEDSNFTFFNASGVAVDSDDRIYVADSGNYRIQRFTPNGSFSATIGRAGQGPGEFQDLWEILISGERLWAYDAGRARFAVFDMEGAYQGESDVRTDFPFIHRTQGRADGTAILAYEDSSTQPRALIIERIDARGLPLHEYARLELSDPFVEASGQYALGVAPEPTFAASDEGPIYVTGAGDYRVVAFAPDGEQLWAIDVDWPRRPVDEAITADAIERNDLPATADVQWPELLPAIAWIGVDGHGNLYVFPNPYGPSPEVGHVVDVYSPTGELLLNGTLDVRFWEAARGDYVYDMYLRADNLETEIARYRLADPSSR